MEIQESGIPGCFLMKPRVIADARGSFVKTYHRPSFEDVGLRTDWREEYYSTSREGVVRGMHFQTPPKEHAKLVYCVAGEVIDVVLDLRVGSPTHGQHRAVQLHAAEGAGLYIPSGCAHGFASLSPLSTMAYKVTSVHSPENDAGLAWDSFGFEWPFANPLISKRDRVHPPLVSFITPFLFDPERPQR